MKPKSTWISLKAARYFIEDETGHLPSRQTMYNWARSGKLPTHKFKPYRTTRELVRDFLATRRLK